MFLLPCRADHMPAGCSAKSLSQWLVMMPVGVHRSVQSPAPLHNLSPRPWNAVAPTPAPCAPPEMDRCQVGGQLPIGATSPSHLPAAALQSCLPPVVHLTHAQSIDGPQGASAAVSSPGAASMPGTQPAGQAVASQMVRQAASALSAMQQGTW